MKVQLIQEVDANEFWSSVFGSCWETHPWWQDFKFEDGSSWDVAGCVHITAESPEDESETIARHICLPDVVRAYNVAKESYQIDWEELDASTSDVIIQIAVYGEAIFG